MVGTSRLSAPPSSEENIEVEHESPIVVPKEDAVLRIGNVRVHFQGIEMVGQIVDCPREPDCMFGVHLNIFRNSQVEREVFGKTILRTAGCSCVLLDTSSGW